MKRYPNHHIYIYTIYYTYLDMKRYLPQQGHCHNLPHPNHPTVKFDEILGEVPGAFRRLSEEVPKILFTKHPGCFINLGTEWNRSKANFLFLEQKRKSGRLRLYPLPGSENAMVSRVQVGRQRLPKVHGFKTFNACQDIEYHRIMLIMFQVAR